MKKSENSLRDIATSLSRPKFALQISQKGVEREKVTERYSKK